jgi:transcriptional regulator of acetoin/glycerol metabolism
MLKGGVVPTLLDKPELNQALQRVAELEAEVRELRATSNGHADAPGLPPSGLPTMRLNEVEALLVRRAMAHHGGNISRAARQLGLSRSALYRRLDRHKI